MYHPVTTGPDYTTVGPLPQHLLVCPFKSDLHAVLDQVDQTRINVENSIVKNKHQGGPIKTEYLLTLVDHVDVAHINTTPIPAKERRQELSQAKDGAVFSILPLLTRQVLKSRGMNITSLPRAKDDDHFRITGVLTKTDADLQTKVAQFFMLEDYQLTLMNQHLHDILHTVTVFNMSSICMLKHQFHAVLAFQTIHIAMMNRILAEKGIIASDFTALSSARALTLPDILHMTKRLNKFSIALDALCFRSCFDASLDPQVLTQILDTI